MKVSRLELPVHKFSPGDLAGIYSRSSGGLAGATAATGVVHSLTACSMSVCLDKNSISLDDSDTYHLLLGGSDVTYKLLTNAVTWLRQALTSYSSPIAQIAFQLRECSEVQTFSNTLISPISNTCLNDCQKQAVLHAIYCKEISMIHGPPGTGKTTTLVALADELLLLNSHLPSWSETKPILICAPSNVAVDNVAESFIRLTGHRASDLVRLGHPSRISERLESISLDFIINRSDEGKLCVSMRKDLKSKLVDLKTTLGKFGKREISMEINNLRKDLKCKERIAISNMLKKSKIIFSTCTAAAQLKKIDQFSYDIVIIDEAAQALEMACWIPILAGNAKKLILAGDHKQLSPTVKSEEAARRGLNKTLFARLQEYGNVHSSLLSVQYRMNEKIMNWSNEAFYGGNLEAHASASNRTLIDLVPANNGDSSSVDDEIIRSPIIWVDTANGGPEFDEEVSLATDASKGNPGEVLVIKEYVKCLLGNLKISGKFISVITPYTRQQELIHQALRDDEIKVATVDSFQGGENEVIILSLVRSNLRNVIGFLDDEKRLNVSVTRAKRQLVLIGNSSTLSEGTSVFLKSLFKYVEENGLVLPVETFFYCLGSEMASMMGSFVSRPFRANEKSHSVVDNVKPSRESNKMNKQRKDKEKIVAKDLKVQTLVSTEILVPKICFKEETETKLKNIMAGEIINFPSSLTSHERLEVHTICETLDLEHVSLGEGKDRRITVSKKCATDDSQIEKISNFVGSNNKNKLSPKRQSPRKGKSGDSKPSPIQVVRVTEDSLDFDSLVSEFSVSDRKHCYQTSCNVNVKTIFCDCPCCHNRFCFSHAQPEIHGCGKQAANRARKEWISQSHKKPSTNSSSSNKQIGHLLAQNRLDKKLSESQQSRSKKSAK